MCFEKTQWQKPQSKGIAFSNNHLGSSKRRVVGKRTPSCAWKQNTVLARSYTQYLTVEIAARKARLALSDPIVGCEGRWSNLACAWKQNTVLARSYTQYLTVEIAARKARLALSDPIVGCEGRWSNLACAWKQNTVLARSYSVLDFKDRWSIRQAGSKWPHHGGEFSQSHKENCIAAMLIVGFHVSTWLWRSLLEKEAGSKESATKIPHPNCDATVHYHIVRKECTVSWVKEDRSSKIFFFFWENFC